MSEFAVDTQKHARPRPLAGRPFKYPWADMQVDDSFFVPDVATDRAKSILSSGYNWAGRHNSPARFSMRKVNGGYRFWRIA